MILEVFLDIFQAIAIGVGVGAATVGVAHILVAKADHFISPDEERLLRVDEYVIKSAFFILFFSQAIIAYFQLSGSSSITLELEDVITWSMLSIIFTTMVFIGYGVIRESHGIVVQLTTWYALAFISALPTNVPIRMDVFMLSFVFFTIFTLYIVAKVRSSLVTTHTTEVKQSRL